MQPKAAAKGKAAKAVPWAGREKQNLMSVRKSAGNFMKYLWRGFSKTRNKVVYDQKQSCINFEIEGGNPSHPLHGSKKVGDVGLPSEQCLSQVTSGGIRGFEVVSARSLFIDNVLKRVTNSQAATLRRRAVQQLTSHGNSAPFLSLLGVSLAPGSGLITKEDEIESVCYEIRQAVSRTRLVQSQAHETESETHNWSLENFELGKPIAKGCAAVVFSARNRNDTCSSSSTSKFPLAIKMMFNYHAASNAFTILRFMHRETVPAGSV